jgi:hypothetical protein
VAMQNRRIMTFEEVKMEEMEKVAAFCGFDR